MYGIFNPREFSIIERPSREHALAALDVLKELLTEFSFAGPDDLAAALCALLTATIRPSLNLAPMFHVRAHMVGSGKTYLCELITAFATPLRSNPAAFPDNDEECRKLLLAELLRSPAVIEFDNLTTDLLAYKSLCSAITSEFKTDRILGVSKTATVNTRALFLSSGNNVGPVEDMTRRCITIHLSPQCEIPAARTFQRPNLVHEVYAERAKYVSAALTIILAWLTAGKPKTDCPNLASFGQWTDWCRQPLLWLGCADPATSVFKAIAEDPNRETLARLLHVWFTLFGKTPVMVRRACLEASLPGEENDELNEILRDIAEEKGDINRRRLGNWLRRHAGRIVDGMRFIKAEVKLSAEAWQINVCESVTSVKSVSLASNEKSVGHCESYRNAYAAASRGE